MLSQVLSSRGRVLKKSHQWEVPWGRSWHNTEAQHEGPGSHSKGQANESA